MSLLAELNAIAKQSGFAVETGVFTDTPPDAYLGLTPMADSFGIHADNAPGFEIQEVRLSPLSKGSYTKLKNTLIRAILAAEITITDRRYVGHEDDTGYHNYAIDAAKHYEMEE